jgi:WD40 repeat protein
MNIRHLHSSTGHRSALYALTKGRHSEEIFSAGGDGWIVAWNSADPEIGRVVANIETQIFSLCHLPDQQLLVAGDMNGGVYWIDLCNTANTRGIQHHKKGVYSLCYLGLTSLLSAGGDGVLSHWDSAAQKVTDSLHLSNKALRCVVFYEKSRILAVGDSNGHIFILDADSLAIVSKIEMAHKNSVFSLAFSPDGQYLFSGGRDAMLQCWDIELGEPRKKLELPAHWFTINHIAFSPDGSLFATASRDKTFKLWDAKDLRLLKVVDTVKFGSHNHSVNRLLWLSDQRLVTCSDDRSVMFWELSKND